MPCLLCSETRVRNYFLLFAFPPCLSMQLLNIRKMNKIVYKLVYNRKKILNRKGEALVQVEAYLNRRKKYFSTHIYLKPEQWDARKERVRKHPNAEALNRQLYAFRADMEKKELQLWRQGHAVTLEALKTELQMYPSGHSFLSFFEQEVNHAAVKESTRRNQMSTFKLLHEFRRHVQFPELTLEFLCDFEVFMRKREYHANTIAKHMKHLKQQINAAIHKGYLSQHQHPFRHYKIKTGTYRHTHLNPEELKRLERLTPDPRSPRLQHTLDAFLFCCYAGLRYSDFTSLSDRNIVNIGRERWLVYRSVKTQAEVRLPLSLLFEGKCLAILDKYATCPADFFRLSDNSNVNKRLRILGRLAGLEKPFSFHAARHTNATLLIYKGVNITTVQKLLGHKNVRTTQIYANVSDRTIVHDLKSHSR